MQGLLLRSASWKTGPTSNRYSPRPRTDGAPLHAAVGQQVRAASRPVREIGFDLDQTLLRHEPRSIPGGEQYAHTKFRVKRCRRASFRV